MEKSVCELEEPYNRLAVAGRFVTFRSTFGFGIILTQFAGVLYDGAHEALIGVVVLVIPGTVLEAPCVRAFLVRGDRARVVGQFRSEYLLFKGRFKDVGRANVVCVAAIGDIRQVIHRVWYLLLVSRGCTVRATGGAREFCGASAVCSGEPLVY